MNVIRSRPPHSPATPILAPEGARRYGDLESFLTGEGIDAQSRSDLLRRVQDALATPLKCWERLPSIVDGAPLTVGQKVRARELLGLSFPIESLPEELQAMILQKAPLAGLGVSKGFQRIARDDAVQGELLQNLEPLQRRFLWPRLGEGMSPFEKNRVLLREIARMLSPEQQRQMLGPDAIFHGTAQQIGALSKALEVAGQDEATIALYRKLRIPRPDLVDGSLHERAAQARAWLCDEANQEALQSVVDLVLDGRGLFFIPEEIARFTGLQQLYIHNNQIASLEPLRGLTKLCFLRADCNQISSLEPLTGLTNLEHLYVSHHHISSLEPLRGLTGLLVLGIEHNQISSLEPLRGLTKLRAIIAYQNRIPSLEPLRGLTELKRLEVSHNQIPESELSAFTHLQIHTLAPQRVPPNGA